MVSLRKSLKAGIAMILGIDELRQEASEDQNLPSRKRCDLCLRHKDIKTTIQCLSCYRPMCNNHRMYLCIDWG